MSNKKDRSKKTRTGIGTLNENSLHADIIQALTKEGDQLEADLDGFLIDILRENKAIEVQTSSLGKITQKVNTLAKKIPVEVVVPIQQTKLITKINIDGEIISQRKSPKNGRLTDIFDQLVRATDLFDDPNTSLTILLIEGEEVWIDDGFGSWRRKGWSIHERNLVKIISSHTFKNPENLLNLLPKSLPSPFTNKQLAKILRVRPRIAGKITYTFRKMNLLNIAGKEGKAYQFEIV